MSEVPLYTPFGLPSVSGNSTSRLIVCSMLVMAREIEGGSRMTRSSSTAIPGRKNIDKTEYTLFLLYN